MEQEISKVQSTEPMGLENEQSKENYLPLATNEPIDKTPFRLIGVNDKYFIAYGLARVTESYKTREEALALVENKDWGMLLSVVIVMMKNIEADRQPGETIDEMLTRLNG